MSDAPIPAVCGGGPLDGQIVAVGGDGFLAADKLNNRAWLYRREGDTRFRVCTDVDDSTVYTQGEVTGERVLDWDRLPADLPVVPLVDAEENYAGPPVDDGWAD